MEFGEGRAHDRVRGMSVLTGNLRRASKGGWSRLSDAQIRGYNHIVAATRTHGGGVNRKCGGEG